MNIDPAPNNGTSGTLYHLLNQSRSLPQFQLSRDYKQCDFPLDQSEYDTRVDSNDCTCNKVSILNYICMILKASFSAVSAQPL